MSTQHPSPMSARELDEWDHAANQNIAEQTGQPTVSEHEDPDAKRARDAAQDQATPLHAVDTEADPWSKVITGAELDQREYPPLEYLHDDVSILTGGLIYLAGPPKAAKSLLALGIALSVAQGGNPFGSHKPVNTTGSVLYISLDDASERRAQSRLRSLNNDQPLPANFHLYVDGPFGVGSTAADHLHNWMGQAPDTSLIVVDTLEALRPRHTPGGSHYSDDVQFLASFRKFLSNYPTLSLLALGHTRKGDDDDAITSTGGTHGITGGADQILRLTGTRQVPRRVLDIISRDDDDKQLVFSIGEEGLRLTSEDPNDPLVHMTEKDQQVYKAVRDQGEPSTAVDLRHLNIPDTGNRLSNLTKRGFLVKSGRGAYDVP